MTYEVALWRYFRGGPELPHVDEVEATSAFAAVLLLMDGVGWRRVAHAAARLLPNGPIERWEMGEDFWISAGSVHH